MSRKSNSIGSSIKDSNQPATGEHGVVPHSFRTRKGWGTDNRVSVARRIARAAAVVLFLAVLTVGGFVYYANHTARTASAIGEIPPPAPKPGGARPWEIEIPVSTYSSWHTMWGNTITRIPLTRISGTGPDVNVVLYHNAASVNASYDISAGSGIDLGPGWTMSFGSQLRLNDPVNPTSITVVSDDGTEDVFLWGGMNWYSPPGVHTVLEEEGDGWWRLTYKDQSYDRYYVSSGYDFGRMYHRYDAIGNRVEVRYGGGSIDAIKHNQTGEPEGMRSVSFWYDAQHRLEEVVELRDEVFPPASGEVIDRIWKFTYDASDRIETIKFPGDEAAGPLAQIALTYTTAGRIATITDLHIPNPPEVPDTWTYTYNADGYLSRVDDPDPASGTALAQTFDTKGVDPDSIYGTYTDRRGNDWEYRYSFFNAYGVTSQFDPLLYVFNPLQTRKQLDFDNVFNLVTFTDELLNESTFTYDTDGNLLTLTDPLSHVQTWTYNGDNNVTSYVDAATNQVDLVYGDLDFPTLLTEIQEPGSLAPTTTLVYYGPTDPQAGALKMITDPNGVDTQFGYDKWGYVNTYDEGSPEIFCTTSRCSCGYVRAGRCSPCGVHEHDAMGNPIASSCCESNCQGCPQGLPPAAAALPSGFPKLPCTTPSFPKVSAGFSGAQYSPKGQLTSMPTTVKVGAEDFSRTHTAVFNELGLLTHSDINSDESGDPIVRGFDYAYDLAGGTITRTGPDGVDSLAAFDAANRLGGFVRGGQANVIMSATFTYYANNLVKKIAYGNGASANYWYDAAGRVTIIHHKDSAQGTILSLVYTYTVNNLVESITESDAVAEVATVDYEYYAGGQLKREVRDDFVDARDYDWTYVYDAGGNRVLKKEAANMSGDPLTRFEERYVYDVDNGLYGTMSNRLMTVERVKIVTVPGGSQQSAASGGPGIELAGGSEPLAPLGGGGAAPARGGGGSTETTTTVWTKYYVYDRHMTEDAGNIVRIIKEIEEPEPGEKQYSATRFEYALNAKTVTFVLGEEWDWNGGGGSCPSDYEITFAREFRYDGARQRYLNRTLDLGVLNSTGELVTATETWSDYDGDSVYGDFSVNGGSATNLRSFEPGIGSVDQWTSGGTQNTKYVHMDMLGSSRASSVYPGDTGTYDTAYTAFGEPAMGSPERDGYAGSWGYQTHDEFDAMHVGHRYYDPSVGRFLQRDPIGIRGGTNVYAYTGNVPTIAVDPNGKFLGIIVGGIIGGLVGGAVGGWNGGLIGAVAGLVGGTVSGAIAGTGVGAGVAGAAGGAVGGAVAGALGGYGNGKGAAGIAASAGIGAVAGAVTGGVGGSAVGGAAGRAGSSAAGGSGGGAASAAAAGGAGSIASAALTTYFDDLPSAMICAAERLGRRR